MGLNGVGNHVQILGLAITAFIHQLHVRKEVFSFENCTSNKRLFHMLKKFGHLYTLLWGITLWYIWKDHNDVIFNKCSWHKVKLEIMIWECLFNYGLNGNAPCNWS